MGKYSKALGELTESVEYWAQLAMRRFVGDVVERMETNSMTRAKLAERLGASPAYVSRAMKGDVNFTLETMTKLALATGGRLDIRIVDNRTSALHSQVRFNNLRLEVPSSSKPATVYATTNRLIAMDNGPANDHLYSAPTFSLHRRASADAPFVPLQLVA